MITEDNLPEDLLDSYPIRCKFEDINRGAVFIFPEDVGKDHLLQGPWIKTGKYTFQSFPEGTVINKMFTNKIVRVKL